ncbi:MAG TPA: MFS transporter [Anaerolineae bacterium]|nr:MFS transporter [Anaerolineae bacterium]
MPRIRRYAWHTLSLLVLANWFNFYNRQIVSVLAEAIKAEFHLTDMQVGGMNSAFEFTYPLAAVVLAIIADRWGRQRIIAVVVALWSAATALTGTAGSYLSLIVTRLGVGVGQGGYGPPALAVLSEVFPATFRAQAVGIHAVGLILGSATGYLASGVIAQSLGWRTSFIVAGLPGLLLAWLIWRFGTRSRMNPSVQKSPRTSPTPQPAADALRHLIRIPTLRVVYTSGILIYLATGGLIFWMPTFLQRYHGYTLASAATVAGVAQVVVGVVGVLAGGWLGDYLSQRHPGGKLITMGLGLAIGTPLGIVGLLAADRTVFLITVGMAFFLFSFNFSCNGPQIHDVTPPAFRATTQSIFLFLTHYLGNLPSAPLIGWLSDVEMDLRVGMVVFASLGLLAALVMLWGARSVVGDIQLESGNGAM